MVYTVKNLDTGVTTEVDPSKEFRGAGKPIRVTIVGRDHPLGQMLDGKISPEDYLKKMGAGNAPKCEK